MKKILRVVVPLFMITALIMINAYNQNKREEIKEEDVIEFYDDDFTLESYNEDKALIMTFYMPNCPACEALEPVLYNYALQFQDQLTIKYIDITKNTDLYDGYPVLVTPTSFFFDENLEPIISEEANIKYYENIESKEHVYTVIEGYFDYRVFDNLLLDLGVDMDA